MLIKNEIYEGVVSGIGTECEGIIKSEGTTVFVPFCLYGEKVKFKVLKSSKSIAYGKAVEIIEKSAERVSPECEVFTKCGGCNLQHASYIYQLDVKRQNLADALKKIGGIEAEVQKTIPCEKEYGYRNKLVLPIGADDDGVTQVGFYASRSHRIVPISECPIQAEWAKDAIAAIKDFAKKAGGYNEVLKKGTLKRFVARYQGGFFIFVLVATERLNVRPLIEGLKSKFKDFTLVLNVDKSTGNAVFGNEWYTEYGSGFFEGEEQGIKYTVGAETFLQVNDDVRKKLYSAIIEKAKGVCINLYSGAGMLTAMLAKNFESYGVEINEQASRCADELKEKNGLKNMHNVCGDAEEKISEILCATSGKERTIVCDPPRKGMSREVVRAIMISGAERVILVSCNPATLARDLGLLCGTLCEVGGELKKIPTGDGNIQASFSPFSGRYKIESITPFDMFPQTKWVETLVVLSHKKPDGHINVKVEFGEEEGQVSLKEVSKRAEARKPKDKVTYKKMQDYIEKTYGFKVHTAYIAEVKRDLGLPMYDAPNAVEELKRPRAHPTPKMVEAIKETLKHFDII